MKNVVFCKNCSAENPFFSFICNSCKSYLRERVVNIDLWDTLGVLIDRPVKAFSRIIFAEHKNFIFFILFIVSIKFFINTYFISSQVLNIELNGSSILYFIFIFSGVVLTTALFSFILKNLNSIFKVKTRFFDNFAILAYSEIPHIYALIFLFTVELVLFGRYLVSYNPSPYLLKPVPAYTLTGMEGIILLWSIVLTVTAIYSQTKSKLYSFIMGVLYNCLLIGMHFAVIFILR
jgi:hypothetical protein